MEVKIPVESTGNSKVTGYFAKEIEKAEPSEWNGKTYLWIKGTSAQIDLDYKKQELTIYTGARYLYVHYHTGSWKNTYESFTGIYDTKEKKWILKVGETTEVNREEYNKAKSEMLDEGYALSKNKPAQNVMAYYFMKNLQEQEEKTTQEKIAEEIAAIERRYGCKIEWRVVE